MTAIPSIACLGVIGKNNNPLHVAIFPSAPTNTPLRTPIQFSLILSSTLDVFEIRSKANTSSASGLSGDFGLLHVVDERLAAYGFETNTGVRFVVVIDTRGRVVNSVDATGKGISGGLGLREGELRVVFRAMQSAYVRLLQNPFYDPDEHCPPAGRAGKPIVSRRFAEDMGRIGKSWAPGVGNL